MNLKKVKIILPICFGVVICVLAIGWNLISKNDTDVIHTTIKDYYFKDENIKCINKIYNKKEQSHKIDDYIITLKESLIDKKSSTGYLLFTINKLKGKPKMDIGGGGGGLSALVSDRFYIELPKNGVNTKTYAYDGDTLYQYIVFSYDDNFDGKINYYDSKEEDLSKTDRYYKHKGYTFDIKLESVANEYKINENTILYISPLGLNLKTNKKIDDLNIQMTDRKGEDRSLLKIKRGEAKNGSVNIRNKQDNEYTYNYIFDDLLDISSIEYISYNNKKIIAE